MKEGKFWSDQVQQLQEEYAKTHQNVRRRTIRFSGLTAAFTLLHNEERQEDVSEFIALVAACLLAQDPAIREKNEDRLDYRFRDLLERAIMPPCKECGNK